jgi:anti-anti-sigma factor
MTEVAALSLDRRRNVAVATVSGEIDFSAAHDIERRILAWTSNEDAALILDLTTLSYIDSAGINVVFHLAARLREHGQALSLVIPADSPPSRTLSMVGIDKQVPVFHSIDQAVADQRSAGEL